MKIFKKTYPSLPSTQPVCIEACKQYLKNTKSDLKYKAVRIDAEEQPKGVGRNNTSWTHFKGNICTSIGFKVHHRNTLPLLVYYPGYILNKYFLGRKFDEKIEIKFPNDLFYGGKKVGGTITTCFDINDDQNNDINSTVVCYGMGINTQKSEKIENAEIGDLKDFEIENDEFLDFFTKEMYGLLKEDVLSKDNSFQNSQFLQKLNSVFRETDKRVAVYSKETGEFEFTGVFKGVDINGNARYIQDGNKGTEIKDGLLKSIKIIR